MTGAPNQVTLTAGAGPTRHVSHQSQFIAERKQMSYWYPILGLSVRRLRVTNPGPYAPLADALLTEICGCRDVEM